MARAAGIFKNSSMLPLNPFTMQGRCSTRAMLPRLANVKNDPNATIEVVEKPPKKEEHCAVDGCWIPHPRTGIYFPKGHESVMEDVPNDAAMFDRTFWLRNIDGVEDLDKPYPVNVRE